MSKVRSYERDDLIVEFEAARCIHAAECVRGLPRVFDPEKRPWIDPQQAEAPALEAVIRRCPTGALRFRRPTGNAPETPDPEASVRIVADGPLHLRGDLKLARADGTTLRATRLALCRCGASRNKPFCDNSHGEAGFRDPGVIAGAPAPADAEAPAGIELTPAADGPVIARGSFTLTGADGTSGKGSRAALCRCGASATKPFCDGSHQRVGFRGE